MRFYLRKKAFSLKNEYLIKNAVNEVAYIAIRNLFSKRKYKIFDTKKKLFASIEKKLFRISPKYEINLQNGKQVYIKKKFGVFTNIFMITSNEDIFTIDGDVVARNYDLLKGDKKVAIISEDTQNILRGYDINISKYEDDPILILSIVLVIHLAHYSHSGVKYKNLINNFKTSRSGS